MFFFSLVGEGLVMRFLYGGAIFIAAMLLFQVQLILGKHLLPWFGGTPGVWTTSMLFFQVMLLAGYAYAHALDRWVRGKWQGRLHAGLILLSVLLLAVLQSQWGAALLAPSSFAPEAGSRPAPQLLRVLFLSAGIPFFLLASTSPLLQRWFSLSFPGSPYRLYALSNAGSLLGLLSYPFLIEPWLDLERQSSLWSGAYLLFALAVIRLAGSTGKAPGKEEAESPETAVRIPTGQKLLWLTLSAAAVAMMLAVTQQLSQEVAVIPLLWVLPLAVYLLTFILCFDKPEGYRRNRVIPLLTLASFAILLTSYLGIRLQVPYHVIAGNLFLYLFCRACHGELVHLRPARERLTLFYLFVSMGGVLGGVLISLLAPAVFRGQWDFYMILILGWVLLAVVFYRDSASAFYKGHPAYRATLLLILGYMLCSVLLAKWIPVRYPVLVSIGVALMLTTLVQLLCKRRGSSCSIWWGRLGFVLILFLAESFLVVRMRSDARDTVYMNRNFYGSVSVRFAKFYQGAPFPSLQLLHGSILHGMQRLQVGTTQEPVSYYTPTSGVVRALNSLPRRNAGLPVRMGVLGMGVGTMAAFGKAGDDIRFYEINPLVMDLAVGPHARFSFINKSPASSHAVLADARLALQREWEEGTPGQFDLLVMDAFTSDAVPAHLLTREAFALYSQHLRDEDSIIAVNISNRFLDLQDLVLTQARDLGFHARVAADREPPRGGGACSSLWVLLSPGDRFLQHEVWADLPPSPPLENEIRWTDRHSGLLPLLRWGDQSSSAND